MVKRLSANGAKNDQIVNMANDALINLKNDTVRKDIDESKRLDDVIDIVEIILDFNKLKKVKVSKYYLLIKCFKNCQ